MSFPAPLVISEYTQIKFDVADQSCCIITEEASAYMLNLQAISEKTSLQFREVVACRSVVLLKSDNNFRHEQRMWFNKGPFTFEQFLGMIQYQAGISNDEWYKHMEKSSRVSVLSS